MAAACQIGPQVIEFTPQRSAANVSVAQKPHAPAGLMPFLPLSTYLRPVHQQDQYRARRDHRRRRAGAMTLAVLFGFNEVGVLYPITTPVIGGRPVPAPAPLIGLGIESALY